MKILTLILALLILNNCSSGNVSKISFGKKCSEPINGIQESSYIWLIEKGAAEKSFLSRYNKENCLKS